MPNFNLVAGYSATNWWLRSPNTGNANNVYNVNTTGVLTNNNANNGNGCAPDRKHRQLKVSAEGGCRLTAPKSVQDCKEPTTSLAKGGGTHTADAVGLRAVTTIPGGLFLNSGAEVAHGIR